MRLDMEKLGSTRITQALHGSPELFPPGWEQQVEESSCTAASERAASPSSGRGEVFSDPQAWAAKTFPDVFRDDPGYFVMKDRKGGFTRVGNERLIARCLGPEGSPEAPLVYRPEVGAFYRYQPRTGLYELLPDELVEKAALDLMERCARACTPNVRKQVRLASHPGSMPNVVKAAKMDVRRPFPSDPTLSIRHVENGVLDLKSLRLHPFTPDRIATSKIPIAWDEAAPEPVRFQRFLKNLLPDEADQDLALDCMAMALLGNPFQRLLIIRGPGGSGKGTLLKLLMAFLGDTAGPLNLRNAHDRFSQKDWDRLLLHEDEAQSPMVNRHLDLLKLLSGHGDLAAPVKYRNEVHRFQCRALVTLVSNENLTIDVGSDCPHAWRRRLIVLETAPVDAQQRESAPTTNYEAKLLEAEGPGILRLLAYRAMKMQGENFHLTLNEAQQVRVDQVTQTDPLHIFVEQHVRPALPEEVGHVYRKELKARAVAWLERHGANVPSDAVLGRELNRLMEKAGGTLANSLPPKAGMSRSGWRNVILM